LEDEQFRTEILNVPALFSVVASTVMVDPVRVEIERLDIFPREALRVETAIVVVEIVFGLKVQTDRVEKLPRLQLKLT